MNGSIRYLQTRKDKSAIFFKCLTEKVAAIIINIQSDADFEFSDVLLTEGVSAEKIPFILAKKQDLPYTGERNKIIETLIHDGFSESSAQDFERAEAIYQQANTK
ncbi:hypothetical protein Fleli_3191 [Bernardetia litoralis DSM 6794]|uniref:Uncharacterized protein n=1 Tax=Bernardetia litoralis (strain ATCC 23117 / DSM 6794 / NBRC 15988 / NCIMB 1366 / Fx l1 / Sio-4) TaxID=880071 RepID=I4ANI8_BERLS|nr:hypothetical protein [Bernardetia litoralis]AFM05523.1 hypothetical protein Fleli_3191 [Bernardetia litoralis DSM 6794]